MRLETSRLLLSVLLLMQGPSSDATRAPTGNWGWTPPSVAPVQAPSSPPPPPRRRHHQSKKSKSMATKRRKMAPHRDDDDGGPPRERQHKRGIKKHHRHSHQHRHGPPRLSKDVGSTFVAPSKRMKKNVKQLGGVESPSGHTARAPKKMKKVKHSKREGSTPGVESEVVGPEMAVHKRPKKRSKKHHSHSKKPSQRRQHDVGRSTSQRKPSESEVNTGLASSSSSKHTKKMKKTKKRHRPVFVTPIVSEDAEAKEAAEVIDGEPRSEEDSLEAPTQIEATIETMVESHETSPPEQASKETMVISQETTPPEQVSTDKPQGIAPLENASTYRQPDTEGLETAVDVDVVVESVEDKATTGNAEAPRTNQGEDDMEGDGLIRGQSTDKTESNDLSADAAPDIEPDTVVAPVSHNNASGLVEGDNEPTVGVTPATPDELEQATVDDVEPTSMATSIEINNDIENAVDIPVVQAEDDPAPMDTESTEQTAPVSTGIETTTVTDHGDKPESGDTVDVVPNEDEEEAEDDSDEAPDADDEGDQGVDTAESQTNRQSLGKVNENEASPTSEVSQVVAAQSGNGNVLLESSEESETDDVDMNEYKPTLLNPPAKEEHEYPSHGHSERGAPNKERDTVDLKADPYLERDLPVFVGSVLRENVENVRSWVSAPSEDSESDDSSDSPAVTNALEPRGGSQNDTTYSELHIESSTTPLSSDKKEETAESEVSSNLTELATELPAEGVVEDQTDFPTEGGTEDQNTSDVERKAKEPENESSRVATTFVEPQLDNSAENLVVQEATLPPQDSEANVTLPEEKPHVSTTPVDRATLEASEDKDTDATVSVVTWNLAEESPAENEAAFIKKFRKVGGKGSDLVLICGQECENIKPRRSEGRRSREYRRLMIKMLGKSYVPIALHLLGGIQFGLFAKKSFLKEINLVSVADVTCGIGNVFHNKGAIAAFVELKARNPGKGSNDQTSHSKTLKMMFVTAHMAAHVKNSDARDSDFWRISSELEAQAPLGFLPRKPSHISDSSSFLFDSVDRAFFCGDLNYRVDLPREAAECAVAFPEDKVTGGMNEETRLELMRHDQLIRTLAEKRAFPGFSEGKVSFAPTFKFDKDTGDYDTSHKQRIPAWTDRILFKTSGTRVLEYDSVPEAQHSDHRPVFGTYRVNMEGKEIRQEPAKPKSKKRKRGGTKSTH